MLIERSDDRRLERRAIEYNAVSYVKIRTEVCVARLTQIPFVHCERIASGFGFPRGVFRPVGHDESLRVVYVCVCEEKVPISGIIIPRGVRRIRPLASSTRYLNLNTHGGAASS